MPDPNKIISQLQHFAGALGAVWSEDRTWKHQPDGVAFSTEGSRCDAVTYLKEKGFICTLQEGEDCVTNQTFFVVYVRGVPMGGVD